jgi:hypothetical protein
MYQSTKLGYAALFEQSDGKSPQLCRLHPFGMREGIYNWNELVHEKEDELARAIHADYSNQRYVGGDSRSILNTWENLPDALKDSNRRAADHIPIKLRAVGCISVDATSVSDVTRTRVREFSEEEVLLLAQMEHSRWCAERWLDGWEFADETNRGNKTSKDLRPWQELEDPEKEKDFEQIRSIPRVLEMVGK